MHGALQRQGVVWIGDGDAPGAHHGAPRHARGVLTTPSGPRVPSVHKGFSLTVDTLSGEVVIEHAAEP
jgi:hypothetical protein